MFANLVSYVPVPNSFCRGYVEKIIRPSSTFLLQGITSATPSLYSDSQVFYLNFNGIYFKMRHLQKYCKYKPLTLIQQFNVLVLYVVIILITGGLCAIFAPQDRNYTRIKGQIQPPTMRRYLLFRTGITEKLREQIPPATMRPYVLLRTGITELKEKIQPKTMSL